MPMISVVAKPLMGPVPNISEDGGECVAVAVGYGVAQVLAGAEFFFGALEDEHVGVDGHTEGEHDTGDTGECEHGLERCEDAEGEEDVEDQSEVGDEAGDDAVECAHEDHQEDECEYKRPEAVVDGLFTE